MFVLLEKLAEIHAALYEYQVIMSQNEILEFIKIAYMRRESSFITPRTMIRDFIQILNVKKQNPEKNIKELLNCYQFEVEEEQSYRNDGI